MNETAKNAITNLSLLLKGDGISEEERNQIEEAIEIWRIAPDAMEFQSMQPEGEAVFRRFMIIQQFVRDYIRPPKDGVSH